MRNLKRALSLALASVMLLGMMVVGTSALSYGDVDSADHEEAIDLLQAVGVMSGDDKGNFNPDQVVTRAEMAVIICNILYGKNLNVGQFVGTDVFNDVPVWAQGYVNLAASLGIVAGVGDGKFAPNEPVTTAQAALMLCRALGYFQTDAEFANGWMLAATERGTKIGLYEDLTSLSATAGLKRNDVAQMVFNALTETTPVTYNEIFGYYTVGGTLTSGVQTGEQAPTLTLAYKTFDVRTQAKSNHGETGYVWVNRYSSKVLTDFYASDETLATITNGTVISKLTNKSDSKFAAEIDTADIEFFYNGTKLAVVADGSAVSNADKLYVKNNAVYKATGANADSGDKEYSVKGAVVTFLDSKEADGTYDGKAEAVTIVAKTATKLSRDAATQTSGSITETKYTIGVVPAETNVDYVHGYEGLKKDDVVLSVAQVAGQDNNTHYYVEKAETVTGTVTKISSDGKYTLDNGSTYEESQLVSAGTGINTTDAKLGNKVEFALDNGGYVINTKLVEDKGDNYAVIVDYDARTMAGQQTKLLLADGTQTVVNADYLVSGVVKEMATSNTSSDPDVAVVAKLSTLVEYKIEGGVYKLTAMSAASSTAVGTQTVTTIEKGNPQLSSGVYADSETVYILRDSNGNLSKYVGVSNVPDVTATNKMAVGKGNIADYVFATAVSSTVTNDSELIYVASTTYVTSETYKADGSVDKTLKTFQAVKNGEIVDVTVLASEAAKIDKTGVYKINSYDAEGYVSGIMVYDNSGDPGDALYNGYLNKIDATNGVQAKQLSGETLVYGSDYARITNKTVVVKVDKDNQKLTMADTSDIVATSTSGEKASKIVVVYGEKDGALTKDAAVIFIFSGYDITVS